MRFAKTKRFIGLVVLGAVAVVVGFGHPDNPPTNEETAFAKTASDLLHNELVAALFAEFNETTPANVEHGKQAISLIFNNANRDILLIGAFPPFLGGFNGLPSDSFEPRSLTRALQGTETISTERVGNQWFYRRSFPLSNAFHANCVLCHSNFADIDLTTNPGQWVGALMTRVPINNDEE